MSQHFLKPDKRFGVRIAAERHGLSKESQHFLKPDKRFGDQVRPGSGERRMEGSQHFLKPDKRFGLRQVPRPRRIAVVPALSQARQALWPRPVNHLESKDFSALLRASRAPVRLHPDCQPIWPVIPLANAHFCKQ